MLKWCWQASHMPHKGREPWGTTAGSNVRALTVPDQPPPPCPWARTPHQHPGAIYLSLQQGVSSSPQPCLPISPPEQGPPRGPHPGPAHSPGRCLTPGDRAAPATHQVPYSSLWWWGRPWLPDPALPVLREPPALSVPWHPCLQSEWGYEMDKAGGRKMVLFLCCFSTHSPSVLCLWFVRQRWESEKKKK